MHQEFHIVVTWIYILFMVGDGAMLDPSELALPSAHSSQPLPRYLAGHMPQRPGARMPAGSSTSLSREFNFCIAPSFQLYVCMT